MSQLMRAAAEHCDGRLVAVHEGGYSDLYVPFCGLAVMEQLCGLRTKVGMGPGTLWAQVDGMLVLWSGLGIHCSSCITCSVRMWGSLVQKTKEGRTDAWQHLCC